MTYSVLVAQTKYYSAKLGKAELHHHFLAFAEGAEDTLMQSEVFCAQQELHYVWDSGSDLLKATAIRGKIRRIDQKFSLLGAAIQGEERVVRSAWNRALSTARRINELNLIFDSSTAVKDSDRANNCNAGVQAGLDAMGYCQFDFNLAGSYDAYLFEAVKGQVNQDEREELSLEGLKERATALMKSIKTASTVCSYSAV